MSRRLALAPALLALSAFALALALARLAQTAGLPRLDARSGASAAADLLAAHLVELDARVRLEAYLTPAAEAPSHLRHLERRVGEALARLERSAPQLIETRLLLPGEHPEWSGWLQSAGISPWRARRVERDGYVEQPLWSSLRIALGAGPPVVLSGLGLEHAEQLEELCLRHVLELAAPRRPLVLVDAPARFGALRELLSEVVEVREVDLVAARSLPDAQLFVWLEPRAADAELAQVLDAFRSRGGALLLAGSELWAHELRGGAEPAARFEPAGQAFGEWLSHLGLALEGGLILDPSADVRELESGELLPGVHRVRCSAHDQDFRLLEGQPNGNLLFVAPGAFRLDAERLAQRGARASVLATTSELALRGAPPVAPLTWRELARLEAEPLGEVALAALIEPARPWTGPALVLAAASPFEDAALLDGRYRHLALLEIALRTLAGPQARVRADVARALPAPLAPLSARQRLAWRLLAVGAAPLLLGLLALRRGVLGARRGAWASPRRRRPPIARPLLAGLIGGLAAVALLSAGAARLDADWTRGAWNRPGPGERALLAALLAEARRSDPGTGILLETIFSAPARLPPELRPLARGAEELCAELARAIPGLEHRRIRASGPAAERLEREGLAPLHFSSRLDERLSVRRVHAALRVSAGRREALISFPTEASFENLRFRLALAVRSVASDEVPRVVLAATSPRLSPAEATLEFRQRGLIAPRERDAWTPAARLLAGHGFDVRALDTARPRALDPGELLVWLQPRRNVQAMLEVLSAHLSSGGAALVAAQHFELIARQLEASDLALGFWPRPHFADLERFYLPELGIELVRDVLLDSHMGSLKMRTRVDAGGNQPRYETQEASRPFLLIASAARRTAEGRRIFAGVGDALLWGPSRIALEPERLARHELVATPLASTSERAWTFAWKGGELPPGALAGDPATEGVERLAEPAHLAVLVEGSFPRIELEDSGDDRGRLLERGPAPPGRLLLLGASRPFQGEQLHLEGYDHAQLLLASVAHLALPADVAGLLARRPTREGLGYVPPERRLRWRLAVLGAGPSLLLGLAALRRRRA